MEQSTTQRPYADNSTTFLSNLRKELRGHVANALTEEEAQGWRDSLVLVEAELRTRCGEFRDSVRSAVMESWAKEVIENAEINQAEMDDLEETARVSFPEMSPSDRVAYAVREVLYRSAQDIWARPPKGA